MSLTTLAIESVGQLMSNNSSECPEIHRPRNCVNNEFERNHTTASKEVTELCYYTLFCPY